jgi:large repetitive protein
MAFVPWLRLILVGALLGVAGCGNNGGGGGGGGGGEGGDGNEGGGAGAPGADPVTISIADAEMEEGDSGVTELTFTVTLSRASDSDVRVSYRTDDGTGFAAGDSTIGRSDYGAASGTLRFEDGETEQTFTVQINADVLNEADETFTVALSNPTGAEIEDGDARALILNDDALPIISIESATVTELDNGMSSLQLSLAMSAPAARPATVDWTTLDDTATAGADYVANMGTAVFSPGETSQTIQVVLLGDVQDESDEEFGVELSEPVNSQLDELYGIVTILDNDLPTPVGPSLSIGNATVTEGNATATLTFTVSLSEAAATPVSVDYATIDGTAITGGVAATGGRDYQAVSDTVTFAIGETSKQVSVTVYGDTLNEANETLTIELINAMGAPVLDPQGVGTITNDDTAPTISVSNVSVTEGAAGMRAASFVVSLSKSSGQDITVDYDTTDSTADAGADYVADSGTLTFVAGQTSALASIDVIGDLLNETNETFYLDLSGATNATISDSQGLGTISNDDDLPEITIDDLSLVEGDAGSKDMVFSVMLSTASGQDVSVAWTTANDTATASDYTSASGNLTFPAGTTVRTVTIAIAGDMANEPNETFNVDLYSPFNCIIVDAQGVGTIITDDSTLPALNIADASVTEGNAGTLTLSLLVMLDMSSTQTITVDYDTLDITASDLTDYDVASGTLTFDPGEMSQSVDITINGDTLHEPDESLWVLLSGAVNAFVADGDGLGTIEDNDTAPTLSINDVTLTEGNTGTKNATFTISLSAASGFPVSVSYASVDGTAEEGGTAALGQDDYEAASDVALIAAGNTSVQVTVPIKGDVLAEGDETFSVQLSSPQNATIADGQGQCTITNEDGLPTISIDNVSLLEGDAGTKTFTFTVTLSSVSGSQVSVSFATANGTALSGSDYVATSGTVVFDPGETTASIDVTVNGDKPPEGNTNETFFVNLSNAMGATIADNQGLGTILNDD